MERFFDIIFSALAIILLSPLLIPVIIILKYSAEGQVFFLQERIGKGRKSFKIFKFATMLKDSPNIGTGTVTVQNDPRVLPIGKFLRKTKINELPQLLNILFGQMSIIGPRPLTDQTFSSYSENIKIVVSQVKPGLSFILIFITVWTLLFPTTKLPWKLFPDLPEPPNELKSVLNYRGN